MIQSIQNASTMALCSRIQAAAIKCDTYHVFVDWQAHVACLGVCVRYTHTDYGDDVDAWPDAILSERTYLADWCDPVHDLTNIIDQLQRLGVEV